MMDSHDAIAKLAVAITNGSVSRVWADGTRELPTAGVRIKPPAVHRDGPEEPGDWVIEIDERAGPHRVTVNRFRLDLTPLTATAERR